MKKVLHFNQGPLMGKEVEIDLEPATIESLLDTGYCTDVPVAPTPEKEPPKKSASKKAAPKKKRRVRRKMETPEG